MIVSVNNQRVKDLVKLRNSLFSRKSKLFIIEGVREVSIALQAKIEIRELYICKDFISKTSQVSLGSHALKRKINISEVNSKVYEKMAYGNRRDGVIAIGLRPEYKLSDIKLSPVPFIVVADGIEKPGNLGAILRTIDAASVDALIVAEPGTDPYSHQVVRSSVGAVFSKPIVKAASQEILAWIKRFKIFTICAHPEGSSVYTSLDFRKPVALVVGSEEKGVSKFWQNNSDILTHVPMRGKADSLNVSVAAAVLIFEALRQRSL
ncbi:MAG: RNA methyltransferase [Candidatus Omnitrophica bacterium]|nr:RNA methyltransferase [Candidatus Omnitrophota bacterium]